MIALMLFCFKNPLESNHGFIGRPLIGQPFNFIPPQQVHRTSEATNHVDQSVGMLGLVIDTSQQHVLQSDFSTGSIKPGRAGIEKLIDGAVRCPGDEFSPQVIGRSVQTQGKFDRYFKVQELSNRGWESDGRDGHTPRAKSRSIRFMQKADRLGHGLIIGQRFPHSHENQVGDASTTQVGQAMHLLDNLPGSEVAIVASQASRAELAPNRTANLTGDASGSA